MTKFAIPTQVELRLAGKRRIEEGCARAALTREHQPARSILLHSQITNAGTVALTPVNHRSARSGRE